MDQYLIICKPKMNQRQGTMYLLEKRGYKVILNPKTGYLFILVDSEFVNSCSKIMNNNHIPVVIYPIEVPPSS